MKKLFAFAILFICFNNTFADYKWFEISYFHSTGPVSPEYQYNYNVKINADGTGVLDFTKAGTTKSYNFSVSKKNLSKLNSAFIKSGVMDLSLDELNSEKNLIGGPVYNATISMNYDQLTEEYIKRSELKKKLRGENDEDPNHNRDEKGFKTKGKRPIIIIPNRVSENYSQGIHNFYLEIEKLVPNSIWAEALK